MNENIDLTKILKNCPKGWKFYSSVYGDVEFIEISRSIISIPSLLHEDRYFLPEIKERNYPIQLSTNFGEYRVSKTGEHKRGVGECTLFPSREQRDWSKFTAPWYKKERFDPNTLQPFDRVLVRDDKDLEWKINIYSHKCYNTSHPYRCITGIYIYCIPYNDDTKHLVGTTKEAPDFYRYWEE